ncbi:sensor domain-containing protein [Mycobacterium attenuatum]|uniref:sensor domain-containing protein n=1 Tax=Mycobacterium attenuatum TaxID=2341086 RepID=UPI000F0EBED8|nr:sensor domain-containing protein [Mycobacterium attenuatum]VBA62371.1 Serine/threonine-protein kinase PknH [Mycobacterium attenuatum]
MSNDVDPQSPGPEPDPFRDLSSGGSPGQLQGTNDIEPGGTGAQPGGFADSDVSASSKEPVPEYFSDSNGPPLPPVIEAFPGYHEVQQPPKSPKPPKPPKMAADKVVGSRRIRWPAVAISLAGVAVILVAVVVTVLVTSRRGPNPGQRPAPAAPSGAIPPSASPSPTLTTPDQLNGILLSEADINEIMRASSMTASKTYEEMDPISLKVSNPDCQGAFHVGQEAVYTGSGQTAVRAQVLYELGPAREHFVGQAAVTFPSAAEASRFVQNSAAKWKNCANQTVTVTLSDGQTSRWTLASLKDMPAAITLNATQEGSSNRWGCQHALSAVSNVVIDVEACGYHVTDEGGQIADKMVAKAKGH